MAKNVLFLGPAGSGKTVALILLAYTLQRYGDDVHVKIPPRLADLMNRLMVFGEYPSPTRKEEGYGFEITVMRLGIPLRLDVRVTDTPGEKARSEERVGELLENVQGKAYVFIVVDGELTPRKIREEEDPARRQELIAKYNSYNFILSKVEERIRSIRGIFLLLTKLDTLVEGLGELVDTGRVPEELRYSGGGRVERILEENFPILYREYARLRKQYEKSNIRIDCFGSYVVFDKNGRTRYSVNEYRRIIEYLLQ